ncbi:MAG: MFS transporter [Lachnospiraceae bacterium]|nr:MFS transporter [Lachnospiraceae bacterium]
MQVFIGLCVYYFVAFGLIYNGLGMFLTPISQDLNLPFVQVSLSSTIRILTGMVTTAAAGRILPKVELKWFLSLNVLFLAGAAFLISAARSLPLILAGSALMGFAAGFALYAIVPIVLNQWFERPERYVSIATAVGGAGGIVFCPGITWAIGNLGWRGAYRLVGIIVLAVMLPIAFGIIRYPHTVGSRPEAGEEAGGRGKPAFGRFCCFFLFFSAGAILSGMYGHIASAFWAKGFTDGQVGILTALYQSGTTLTQLLFGIVSARLGLKKALHLTLPLVAAASLGLLFVPSSLFLLTGIFSFLLGAGRAFGVIFPLVTRHVYGAARFTRVYSGFYAVFLIFTALSASLFGAVYTFAGSYDGVYLMILGCTVLEIGLVQWIFRSV